ncbi:hypothetical protein ACOSQ2_017167 [Xanthoceras sorbifolium]
MLAGLEEEKKKTYTGAQSDLLFSIWVEHPNLDYSFLGSSVYDWIKGSLRSCRLLALLELPAMIRMLGTGTMARVETSCLAGFGASLLEVMVKLNHPSQQVLRV